MLCGYCVDLGKDTDVSALLSPSKKVWKKTVKHAAQAKTDPDLGNSHKHDTWIKCIKTKIAENHFSPCLVTAAEHHVTSEEEEGEIQLEMLEVTLGTLDLRESEICPSRHQRRRRRKKEQRKRQSDGRPARSTVLLRWLPSGHSCLSCWLHNLWF